MGAACSQCRSTTVDEDQVPDLASDSAPNGPSSTVPNGYTAPSKQTVPSRTVSTAGSVYFDANEGEWHGAGERSVLRECASNALVW